MIKLTEVTEVVYSLRHPETGLFWNGSFYSPKFSKKPHRWSKQSDATYRYTRYLVGLANSDMAYADAWKTCPETLVLVSERIISAPLAADDLSSFGGDAIVLARAQRILSRNSFDAFDRLVRSAGTSTYQFMIAPKWEFVRNLTHPTTLGSLVKNIGHQRGRVIDCNIFLKNQKDLLMLKMQGLVEIETVHDLFAMELLVHNEDWVS